MKRYSALVKYSNSPGSAVGKVYVQADNPFQAYAMLLAMYGSLLVSKFASIE